MDAAKLNQLKSFIEQCKANPSILQDPSLSFFKDYLESLGAKVPHTKVEIDSDEEEVLDGEEDEGSEPIPEPEYESDEVVESDLELEGEIVEHDNDPPQKMGDSSVEVTEES